MKSITFLVSICISIQLLAQENSPYINKVYDFQPAPGQFVNVLPKYIAGDTREDMISKVEECITGDTQLPVSLGAYGGNIIFGFDHMVVNVAESNDFKVWGNAFVNTGNDGTKDGGNCEPGIVMVSYDANANGIPDDAWYELAGSEYHAPATTKKYRHTYYKPDESKTRTPDKKNPYLSDTTYIQWENNQGQKGYLFRNTFHNQPYYPQWIDQSTMAFTGTRLANNHIDESGEGAFFVQYAYAWGYADNYPNSDARSGFYINWAVDETGNPVKLPGIHFVKVYTGVNQYCGWLGETSTEITGAEDLHPQVQAGTGVDKSVQDNTVQLLNNPVEYQLIITSPIHQMSHIYNQTGCKVVSSELESGTNYINCNLLPQGIYILVTNNKHIKFLKK